MEQKWIINMFPQWSSQNSFLDGSRAQNIDKHGEIMQMFSLDHLMKATRYKEAT